MFNTFLHAPLQSRSMLSKAFKTVRPVLRQLGLSGYIFVMKMPTVFVSYLGSAGNYSFLSGVHSYGNSREYTIRDAAESMASTLGPSTEECKTETTDHEQYPPCVLERRASATIEHMALYYRHGTATGRWSKSLETITALYSLDHGNELRRMSSGAGLFDDGPKGALKANATIVWGKNDLALDPHLSLDGISDYLTHNSQVVMLTKSGHFTPIEPESRLALEKVTEWAVKGEKEDIGDVLKAVYPGAEVTVRT
jgi:pimeloyl-ACP methyl ester carboxylesterase